MTDLVTLRGCLQGCYDAIEALATRLDSGQWHTQSLCPDWDVRDVVTHLGVMERVMTGWLPASAEDLPPIDRFGPYQEQAAALDDRQFAALISEIFAARRADLAALAPDDLARPSWTPIGRKTYGEFLAIRIFDFWVHERDITTPLGWASEDSGPAAEIALAQVTSSIGYIVGKKVGVPDGKSIVFRLTGPVRQDVSVLVDGRARAVERIDDPDVELTTDSLTFVQLAAGRIDPQAQIDAGKISWTGDAELGDRAARNLRFTM